MGASLVVDMAEHNDIALEIARQRIVLLKNQGALPLATSRPLKIAVIGGHARRGSSRVRVQAQYLVGGYAGFVKIGGAGIMGNGRNMFLFAPSPLSQLKRVLPEAQFDFDPGLTPAEATLLLAKRSDIVIAFGIRVEAEGFDGADLSLPWGQDAVIDAVAAANPNTIVVLETSNPVSMP
jgi:beta-glucosidase